MPHIKDMPTPRAQASFITLQVEEILPEMCWVYLLLKNWQDSGLKELERVRNVKVRGHGTWGRTHTVVPGLRDGG